MPGLDTRALACIYSGLFAPESTLLVDGYFGQDAFTGFLCIPMSAPEILARFRKVLSDKSQPTADRAIAVCWIGHLFADTQFL